MNEILSVVSRGLEKRDRELPQLGKGRRLLVVEDDAAQRKLLRLQLELLGFEVETTSNGIQGLEFLRASRFDAVVCDVEMPMLSGFGVCAEVRSDAKLAPLPVVLVSAICMDANDRKLGLEVGATAYLMRTGTPAEQLEALLEVLLASFAGGSA